MFRPIVAAFVGAGLAMGANRRPTLSLRQSTSLPSPIRLSSRRSGPKQVGVNSEPARQALGMDPRPETRHPQPRHRQGRQDRFRALQRWAHPRQELRALLDHQGADRHPRRRSHCRGQDQPRQFGEGRHRRLSRPDLKDAVADKETSSLRNVLNMTTGLYYDFKPPNDPIYYEAPDRLKLAATTKPLLQPGRVFQYMDVNPILATAMLSAAAGKKLEDYAEEKVFKPLGMKNYAWSRADEKGLVSGGWGLRLRAVDMARLGLVRASARPMAGQATCARGLDEDDDDRPEHAFLWLLLVGSQHCRRRRRGRRSARVRHYGLQGPEHCRPAEIQRRRDDDQHPVTRRGAA